MYKKSSGSTPLEEIKNIIYGGLSSRFWMLRKHMISTNVKNVQAGKAPFYSWQCLTLQLSHRDVDLVIPNEKDMDDLLEVLIDAMQTVNGKKDSAEVIIKKMHSIKYRREYKR